MVHDFESLAEALTHIRNCIKDIGIENICHPGATKIVDNGLATGLPRSPTLNGEFSENIQHSKRRFSMVREIKISSMWQSYSGVTICKKMQIRYVIRRPLQA